jgi:hypothetical protein
VTTANWRNIKVCVARLIPRTERELKGRDITSVKVNMSKHTRDLSTVLKTVKVRVLLLMSWRPGKRDRQKWGL